MKLCGEDETSLCQEKDACHKNVVALKWGGITADTEKETRNSDGKMSHDLVRNAWTAG